MLIYTFRTFPRLSDLESKFGSIFVFSSLKKDLEVFWALIEDAHPRYILGVAATKRKSQIEPVAVNSFGKDKLVLKEAPAKFELHVPEYRADFVISPGPTHSYCNWTMFRIRHFLDSYNKNIKLLFIHINPNDLGSLERVIRDLR